MEQIYLIEIFIDKVTIFFDEQQDSGAKKGLITKVNFGPSVQLIIKEGQLAKTAKEPDDIITCDAEGKRKFTRTIRVGKSYLFPSFPDTVISTLSMFPLEIEVWNDDDTEENNIFVGCGRMSWEKIFFRKLKESADPTKIYEPLSVKQRTILTHECCCKPAAEVEFILRLTPLGGSIITEFQQPLNDPDSIVFRTNKSPSMFICKRKDGDDPNFCMLGSIYESTTLEDPEIVKNATKKIEVCTELQSCGMGAKGNDYRCIHDTNKKEQDMKQYAINKIKMGEISGPCGNANCPLAHKVRCFIRNLDVYKEKAKDVKGTKGESKKICGLCDCKDDREHRETCPSRQPCKHPTCGLEGCSKVVKPVRGVICRQLGKMLPSIPSNKSSEKSVNSDQSKKSDKSGKTDTVAYVFSTNKVPNFKQSTFGRDYTLLTLNATYNAYLTAGAKKVKSDVGGFYRLVKVNAEDTEQNLEMKYPKSSISSDKTDVFSCSRSILSMEIVQGTPSNSVSTPNLGSLEFRSSTHTMCSNNPLIYTVTEARKSNKHCLKITDNKDCQCRKLNSCLKSSISCVDIGERSCSRPMPNMNAAQETQVFNSASIPNVGPAEPRPRSKGTNNPLTYNVTEIKSNKYCLEITDCKCSSNKPAPPCKTLDCDCLQEIVNIVSRKKHRPFYPLFKHNSACFINTNFDDAVKDLEDEDAVEPFAYGVPPIKLGPCPLMGRPCSVHNGFARMDKNAAQPRPQSKQSKSTIKIAVKEYMEGENDHDLGCANVFNINTERSCWDQILVALMKKNCCGTHKLALQDQFKEGSKKQ